MFDFLVQLPAWFWLIVLGVILALALFLARYFRVKSLKVNTGILEIEAERKDKKPTALTSEPASPASGVSVSGGTLTAQRDIAGGSITKRDEYNFANSNVTINPPPVVAPPAPAPRDYVPQHVASVYVQRGIENQVRERLLSGNGVAAIVSVYAPGGVGKTELAIQISNELRAQFEKTFWIDCNDKTPEAALDDTARAVGCALTPNADYEGHIYELAAYLGQRRYLLIFDDVRADNVTLFQKFMPPAPCAALLTSRLTEISHLIPTNAVFHLKTMDKAQARALLETTLTRERVDAEADAAARLLERCRFHPLALDIAARMILKLANEGVAQPLAAIEKRVAHNLDALAAGSDERSNLFAVFAISYDDLDQADQTRFQQLAAFAPSGFGIPAVAFVWGTNARDAETTLERFCNLSLLKHTAENAARYRFHDLLDEYAQSLLKRAGQEKNARDAHAQYLVNLFEEHLLDDLSNARYVADELDNLRAACAWAISSRNGNLVAQLATKPRNWLYNIFRINEEWLSWLNDALELGVSDKELEANTRKAMGDVQQFRKDMDAALTSYEQALGLYRAVGERVGEANTRKAMGDVQQFRKDMDAALTSYEQALGLFRAVGERVGEANTLQAMGDVQQFRKDMDAALTSYEQALGLFRAVGERVGEANTLQAMGDVQQFRKDMDAALKSYEQALGLFREVGDRLGEANTRKAIGDVQQFRKDMDAALKSYEQALGLFREVGERVGEANTLRAMGDVQQFRKDMDAALTSYEQALGLYRAVGERVGEANTLRAMGDVQQFRKDMDAALTSYEQALGLFRAVGERVGEANTLAAQGQLFLIDNPQRADELLGQAVTLFQQIGDRYSIPAQIGNYGWALLRLNQPERAQPYLSRAANLFDQMGLNDYAARHRQYADAIEAATSLARANDHYQKKNYDAAVAEFQAGLEKMPSAQAWNGLGNALESLERFDEAIEAYARAIELEPDAAYLYRNRANVRLNLNRLADAEKDIARAVELEPDSAYTHAHQAELALRRGEFAEAVSHYAFSVAHDEDVDWKFGLALAKFGAGDLASAKAISAEANAQADEDEKKEIRKWFERVAKARPELADAARELL